jgi:phosphoribosylglycinamide formyltransferase-1
VLNVHPSLLPAFPGLDAQRQAWEHGVKVSGATVHLVDEGLDTGPIVLQEAVPVRADDTPQSLTARILEAEHRIYPEAARLVLSGRLVREGRRLIAVESA